MLSLFASSVTSSLITHQFFSSGLLGNLLHLTLGIVVGLDVVLVVLLQSVGGILNTLGFINIFIGIGLVISL
jgi:hypothetical protein